MASSLIPPPRVIIFRACFLLLLLLLFSFCLSFLFSSCCCCCFGVRLSPTRINIFGLSQDRASLPSETNCHLCVVVVRMPVSPSVYNSHIYLLSTIYLSSRGGVCFCFCSSYRPPEAGPIPPELGELSALTELTIGRNRLTGRYTRTERAAPSETKEQDYITNLFLSRVTGFLLALS